MGRGRICSWRCVQIEVRWSTEIQIGERSECFSYDADFNGCSELDLSILVSVVLEDLKFKRIMRLLHPISTG